MLARLKDWALALKRDVTAIYLASSDSRVPWYSKALAVAVAAYALSPIELIPDFIPVLGYLDDLLIVPVGVALVLMAAGSHQGMSRPGYGLSEHTSKSCRSQRGGAVMV